MSMQTPDGIKLYRVFVDEGGHAYLDSETRPEVPGYRITTNIHPDSINRRNKEEGWVGFKSDRAVKVWARKIQNTEKRMSNGPSASKPAAS